MLGVLFASHLNAQTKVGLRLVANATYSSADFEVIDIQQTIANVGSYTSDVLQNAEIFEGITLQQVLNGEVDGYYVDYELVSYRTIDRTGIKPQVGLELSAYSDLFDVSARITNGKYSSMSLAGELQFGLSLGTVVARTISYNPPNSVGFILSALKAGAVIGYDSSFNPIWSLDASSTNKHFNLFAGLDVPANDVLNFHFIASTDLLNRPNGNKQSFIRAGVRYTIKMIHNKGVKSGVGRKGGKTKPNKYY